MICIETERLLLRNLAEKDAEIMFDYRRGCAFEALTAQP